MEYKDMYQCNKCDTIFDCGKSSLPKYCSGCGEKLVYERFWVDNNDGYYVTKLMRNCKSIVGYRKWFKLYKLRNVVTKEDREYINENEDMIRVLKFIKDTCDNNSCTKCKFAIDGDRCMFDSPSEHIFAYPWKWDLN